MTLGGSYHSTDVLRGAGFAGLGRDVRIHDRASLYGAEHISIGNHVRIDDFVVIVATGPLEIGDYVSIPNLCFIGSRNGVVLDDFVTLAPGVKIFSSADDYSGNHLTGPLVPPEHTGMQGGRVVLRRYVIVGAGSVILPGVTLGEGVAVGALSMVNKDLASWGIYAGVPARRLKVRQRNLVAMAETVQRKD